MDIGRGSSRRPASRAARIDATQNVRRPAGDRPPGFSIRIPPCRIAVRGNCEHTIRHLDRYLLPWLPRGPWEEAADLDLRIERRPDAPAAFDIRANRLIVASGAGRDEVFPAVQQAVDDAFVSRLTGRVVVHAATVIVNQVALVFPGPSGSGKTTLVREMIARGAVYGSDEFAIFDRARFVHPWPRPLMIRDAASVQRPCLAAELGAVVQRGPVRAGAIVFLRFARGGSLDLRPVAASDAVLLALQNTPQVVGDCPWLLESLASVCGTVTAWEGIRGSAAAATEGLFRLAAPTR